VASAAGRVRLLEQHLEALLALEPQRRVRNFLRSARRLERAGASREDVRLDRHPRACVGGWRKSGRMAKHSGAPGEASQPRSVSKTDLDGYPIGFHLTGGGALDSSRRHLSRSVSFAVICSSKFREKPLPGTRQGLVIMRLRFGKRSYFRNECGAQPACLFIVTAFQNWPAARAHLPLLQSPSFSRLVRAEEAAAAGNRGKVDIHALVATLPLEQARKEVIGVNLMREIAHNWISPVRIKVNASRIAAATASAAQSEDRSANQKTTFFDSIGQPEKSSQRAYVFRNAADSCRKPAVPARTFGAICGPQLRIGR
jgi:hypothetical protein